MVLDIDASNEPQKNRKKNLSSASYAGMMLDGLMGPLLIEFNYEYYNIITWL